MQQIKVIITYLVTNQQYPQCLKTLTWPCSNSYCRHASQKFECANIFKMILKKGCQLRINFKSISVGINIPAKNEVCIPQQMDC